MKDVLRRSRVAAISYFVTAAIVLSPIGGAVLTAHAQEADSAVTDSATTSDDQSTSAPAASDTPAADQSADESNASSDDSANTADAAAEAPASDEAAPAPEASEADAALETATTDAAPEADASTEAPATEEAAPAAADSDDTAATASDDTASAPAATDAAPTAAPLNDAALSTDKADYNPGDTMSIFGRFFQTIQHIFVRIFGDSEVGNHHYDTTVETDTDSYGSFSLQNTLDNIYRPFYDIVASDAAGNTLASLTVTDAPGAAGNLDQCRNGGIGAPVPCDGSAWVNGNVGAQNAHFVEGDTVPYRMVLTNLPTSGTNTLVIEYDVKNSDKHALDYLTSYNRTETTANPCSGVAGCSGSPALTAIPAPSSAGSPVAGQPTTSFNALAAAQRNLAAWNATVSSVTYVTQGDLNGANTSTQVQIQFTASNATVVMAWGGHIGSSEDWGLGESAGGISGSPYHMRFIELNGKGGNQDRSLAAGAVLPPPPQGSVSGVKFNDANGNGVKDPSELPIAGWTVNLTGAAAGTTVTDANGVYTFTGLLDGTYTVCEGTQAGWTQTFPATGTACPGSTKGYTFTQVDGSDLTGKDFGNTQVGSITVDKVTLPSGDSQSFNFTLSGPTAGSTSLTDAAAPTLFSGRLAGSYTLTEGSVAGWTLTGASCTGVTTTPVAGGVSFTLGAGQNASCTFTNTKQATLTVIKNVINNNGGTKTAADFPLFIDGNSTTNGAAVVVSATTHTVSETAQAGYTQVSITGDCAANGTVTLSPGQNKTCTITNDDQAGSLTVIKHVINDNGGTKTAGNFTMNVTATNPSQASFAGSEAGTVVTVSAGAYSADESAMTGYTKSLSADCSGTIANGQSKTCTITNDDQAAHLNVIKHVINDNGGSKAAADFTMNVTGGAASPASFAGSEAGTSVTLNAGAYSADESAMTGYTKSLSADCTGTLANGETKTCTITNDDQAAHLIVIKHVVNDNGGSKAAADFTMNVTGPAAAPASFAGSEAGTNVTLNAGAYSADESAMTGYTKSLSADCSGSLANGETKTCTVTNDDQQGHLTVIKHVINDNGGTRNAGDFTMNVTATNPSQASFAGSETGTTITLDAGAYSADETAVFGYAKSLSADCSGSIANGESKTCTVTNDDVQPTLTLVKTVTNDNGGTKQVADFALNISGTPTTSGSALGLNAGSYNAAEANLPGYTAGAWTGDCAADGSVTLSVGQNKTCTINNDDQVAHLTVIKHVINDNGGSKTAADFTMNVTATNPSSSSFAGDEAGTTITLDAGAYSADETALSGYTKSLGADCSGTIGNGETKTCTITNDDQAAHLIVIKHVINDNGGAKTAADFTMNVTGDAAAPSSFAGDEAGTNVTLNAGAYSADESAMTGYTKSLSADCSGSLANGETKTCTVTNDDQQGSLTVIKHVVNDNGGTKTAADFTMNVTATNPSSASFAGDEAGTTITLDAGAYSADESAMTGYAKSLSADCSGSIANGESKTCTVTNDDVQPTLTLVKTVTNDNGGTKEVSDFALNVSGTPTTSGNALGINAGSYQAGEANLPGYTAGAWTGDCAADGSVTLSVGDNKTCTINNDDQQGSLTVIKHVINDNGGSKTAADFTMNVTGTAVSTPSFAGDEAGTTVTLDAGAYSADETALAGYTKSLGADCSGSIANGETKTCTITNDDQQGTLTVIKHVINDNGGSKTAADFTMNVTATNPSSSSFAGDEAGTSITLDAGAYSADETALAGYTKSLGADCSGSIANGETKTCTITNDDQQGSLTVIKHVVNDNGGTKTAADFTMSVTATNPSQASFAGDEAGTVVTLDAGAYSADETALTGYAKSLSADCSGSIANGESKTCTVTNDDVQPTLTLVKTVTNDNGGTLQVSDFALNVSGTPTTSGSALGINAGSYTAGETNQPGYTAGAWTGDCAADGSVSLSVGDNKTCTINNNDQPGSITGTKFEDKNGNGVLDAAEPYLSGWIFNVSGTMSGSTTSGANGVFTLSNLSAGTYALSETQQAGWTQTTASPAPIILANGQNASGYLFGNFRKISLSGHKWNDEDGSGAQDNGEVNLAGFTFYVDLNGNHAMDAGEPSALSDANGNYTITNVGPGAWSVCELAQTNWSQTYPVNGGCYNGTATSGQNATGLNFGNMNDREGTIGLWRNWNKHNKYTQTQINGWLSTINGASAWLMSEVGYTSDTTGMVKLIDDATKNCSSFSQLDCADRKLRAQYMVTRLNVLSGRKSLTTNYNLSSFGAAMTYLGISPSNSVSLSTFFAKVEAKANTGATKQQLQQVMSVCDFINNSGI